MKHLEHSEHLYGFSPVWTLKWSFKWPEWINAFSHRWHLYRFSPLWILLCVTRFPACVNRLPQTVHSNGFSPEWHRLCFARAELILKHLPHSGHLHLSLWVFIWLYWLVWDEKHLLYLALGHKFSPVCLFLWSFNLLFSVNRLSHTVHTNGLGLPSCGCSVKDVSSVQ